LIEYTPLEHQLHFTHYLFPAVGKHQHRYLK
jgi:hypothetical protein